MKWFYSAKFHDLYLDSVGQIGSVVGGRLFVNVQLYSRGSGSVSALWWISWLQDIPINLSVAMGLTKISLRIVYDSISTSWCHQYHVNRVRECKPKPETEFLLLWMFWCIATSVLSWIRKTCYSCSDLWFLAVHHTRDHLASTFLHRIGQILAVGYHTYTQIAVLAIILYSR